MMSIFRWLPLLCLPLVCACVGAAYSEGRGKLVVLCDFDNPPFAALDAEQQPIGRDVEMMQQLAEVLGRELTWRRVEFAELLSELEDGDGDLICATLGTTPQRERQARLSIPYFETELVVVVRAGAGEPRALVDLEGLRVAAAPETTAELAIAQHLPGAEGVFEPGADLAQALTGATVDAVVLDGPAGDALVAAHPGQLVRLFEPLAPERYVLAGQREKASFMGRVNGALASLRGTGALQALNERYGLSETLGAQ